MIPPRIALTTLVASSETTPIIARAPQKEEGAEAPSDRLRSGDLADAIHPTLAGGELLREVLDGVGKGRLVDLRDDDLLRLDLLQDAPVVFLDLRAKIRLHVAGGLV